MAQTRERLAHDPGASPSQARYRAFEVRPIAGAMGAEIDGVDLSQPLDDATVAELRHALLEHLAIFFRDQSLSVEQHKAFARRFGTLNVHPQYVPLHGDPEIFPVVKDPADRDNIGSVWHSDVTFLEAPALGSVLYGIEVPDAGGDTLFANQYLAYETLSSGMQRMLEGVRAVHSDRTLSDPSEVARRNATRTTKIAPEAAGKPPIENLHPVLRTHPETGRRSVFVNRAFTLRLEDMTAEESRPILELLYAHCVRPEFTCRFRWRPNSVAFWDNRCTLHYAVNDYPGARRYMHRVTINGDRPA